MNVTLNGTTLSLWHSVNVPASYYYVSVTEPGKAESELLRLRVIIGNGTPIIPTMTPTPVANVTIVERAVPPTMQPEVVFKLNNNPGYTNTTFKVYPSETALYVHSLVTVEFSEGTQELILKATDVPEGDYWVAATSQDKKESGRLKLTVFVKVQTPRPL